MVGKLRISAFLWYFWKNIFFHPVKRQNFDDALGQTFYMTWDCVIVYFFSGKYFIHFQLGKILGIQKRFLLTKLQFSSLWQKFTFLFWQIFLSNFNHGATIVRFDKVTVQYRGQYFEKNWEKIVSVSAGLLLFKNQEDNNFPLDWLPWPSGYYDFIFKTPKTYTWQ